MTAGGRGRGAGGPGGGGLRGRGAGPVASGAPPELIVWIGLGVDTADRAGRARPRCGAVPGGHAELTRYTINEYNTVAHRIKPPFTTIVKYDLNQPAIKWQVPFGDDPTLAARGITGTGAPAINNGLIVTESGLVFGAGRDNQIRAWDSDSGKQLWSARFGGNFAGSPVMYQVGGKPGLCSCPPPVRLTAGALAAAVRGPATGASARLRPRWAGSRTRSRASDIAMGLPSCGQPGTNR